MSKVTLSHQIKGFIQEHKKTSEIGFKNTSGNAKVWWDGYNTAVQQLERRFYEPKVKNIMNRERGS